MSLAMYWWKPYDTPLNAAVSVRRFHRAWFHMARRRLSFTNFGDAVNEQVFRELSGKHVRWAGLGRAEVVGIGSVLDLAERSNFSGAVVGSGIRAADLDPRRLRGLDILAVRGKATAAILGHQDIALGDPALIVREVFPRKRGAHRQAHPVVIPHYGVLNSRAGHDLLRRFHAKGWRVALPNTSPSAMARIVSSAPLVASSSLHGLVFAHSYGIPAAFIDFEANARPEPTFKYGDYYSVFDITPSVASAKDILSTGFEALIEAKEPERATIAERVDRVIGDVYSASRPLRSGT